MSYPTAAKVLAALGLTAEVDAGALASRRQSFESVHMGARDLPIGAVIDMLTTSALNPPRTGHVGNWNDIARGRAGAMDFNHAICSHGYGYPLIYCFTQTEGESMQPGGEVSRTGDWVYLPGSLAERGRRTALPLYTWDGNAFVLRTRERSYFCPLVQTELDGVPIPLVELQRQRMEAIPNFRFVFEADALTTHAAKIREMLTLLLEQASASENPRSQFQDLISHAVAKDGSVERCTIRADGKGYWLNHFYYPSTTALVEATLHLFRSVTDPRSFLGEIASLPPLQPVLSNVVARILTAMFLTHYPDIGEERERVLKPFNVHLHWGARDMAGYPPRQRGYFVTRSKTKSYRIICDTLLRRYEGFDPICFVLLPASIFMLCPTSAHPRDCELLAKLFQKISAEDSAEPSHPGFAKTVERVETKVREWRALHVNSLSPYFLNRFRVRSGVLHKSEVPAQSETLEPVGFRDLTLRQACIIVGALVAETAE